MTKVREDYVDLTHWSAENDNAEEKSAFVSSFNHYLACSRIWESAEVGERELLHRLGFLIGEIVNTEKPRGPLLDMLAETTEQLRVRLTFNSFGYGRN